MKAILVTVLLLLAATSYGQITYGPWEIKHTRDSVYYYNTETQEKYSFVSVSGGRSIEEARLFRKIHRKQRWIERIIIWSIIALGIFAIYAVSKANEEREHRRTMERIRKSEPKIKEDRSKRQPLISKEEWSGMSAIHKLWVFIVFAGLITLLIVFWKQILAAVGAVILVVAVVLCGIIITMIMHSLGMLRWGGSDRGVHHD